MTLSASGSGLTTLRTAESRSSLVSVPLLSAPDDCAVASEEGVGVEVSDGDGATGAGVETCVSLGAGASALGVVPPSIPAMSPHWIKVLRREALTSRCARYAPVGVTMQAVVSPCHRIREVSAHQVKPVSPCLRVTGSSAARPCRRRLARSGPGRAGPTRRYREASGHWPRHRDRPPLRAEAQPPAVSGHPRRRRPSG